MKLTKNQRKLLEFMVDPHEGAGELLVQDMTNPERPGERKKACWYGLDSIPWGSVQPLIKQGLIVRAPYKIGPQECYLPTAEARRALEGTLDGAEGIRGVFTGMLAGINALRKQHQLLPLDEISVGELGLLYCIAERAFMQALDPPKGIKKASAQVILELSHQTALFALLLGERTAEARKRKRTR